MQDENDLDEMNIEILRNKLYKAYLEDFYGFCESLGGTTADVMCPILAVSFLVKFLGANIHQGFVIDMSTVIVLHYIHHIDS